MAPIFSEDFIKKLILKVESINPAALLKIHRNLI